MSENIMMEKHPKMLENKTIYDGLKKLSRTFIRQLSFCLIMKAYFSSS